MLESFKRRMRGNTKYMPRNYISSLDGRIAIQSLLKHPFYVDWTKGTLSIDSLQEYASEYYHFTTAIPGFLTNVLAHAQDEDLRTIISKNLAEEKEHPELWLRFCSALGLSEERVVEHKPNIHTRQNNENFDRLSRKNLLAGAVALYGYERQIPEIAATKINGLKDFYGISDKYSLAFFDVHKEIDKEHIKVWQKIMSEGSLGSESVVHETLDSALSSLWKMLDGVYSGDGKMQAAC